MAAEPNQHVGGIRSPERSARDDLGRTVEHRDGLRDRVVGGVVAEKDVVGREMHVHRQRRRPPRRSRGPGPRLRRARSAPGRSRSPRPPPDERAGSVPRRRSDRRWSRTSGRVDPAPPARGAAAKIPPTVRPPRRWPPPPGPAPRQTPRRAARCGGSRRRSVRAFRRASDRGRRPLRRRARSPSAAATLAGGRLRARFVPDRDRGRRWPDRSGVAPVPPLPRRRAPAGEQHHDEREVA